MKSKNKEKNNQTNNEVLKECSSCGNCAAEEFFLQKNSDVGLDRFFKTCATCRVKSSAKNNEWKKKHQTTNNEQPRKRKLLAERDSNRLAKRLRIGPDFSHIHLISIY
jgi:hypothetical protein